MGTPKDQEMTEKAKIHFPDPVFIPDLQEGVAPPTAVPTSRSRSDPQSCRDPMPSASRPVPSFCTFHPLRVQLQAVHQEAGHSLLLFSYSPDENLGLSFPHLCDGWIWICLLPWSLPTL